MVYACSRKSHENDDALSMQQTNFPHQRRPPQIPSLAPLLQNVKEQQYGWTASHPATERTLYQSHGELSPYVQRFHAAEASNSLDQDRWQTPTPNSPNNPLIEWRDGSSNTFVPSGAMSARQYTKSDPRFQALIGQGGYRYPGFSNITDWDMSWDKGTPPYPLRIPSSEQSARSSYAGSLGAYKESGERRQDRHCGFFPMPEVPFLDGHLLCPSDRFRLSNSPERQSPLSVFVGNIPKNTSPEAFHRLMGLKGTVTEIVCAFQPDRWLTAFVTYSKHSEAIKAVEYFNNRRAIKVAQPHRLVCCFAPQPPASLCCSALPTDLDSGTTPLLPFFPKYSEEKAELMPPGRRSLLAPRFSLLRDGPPGANLFIYGIPSDWTEVTLMRLCQEFGHIVGIRVPGAPTSGQQRLNKGFGFVSYDCTEGSACALESLSGRQFLGKPLNIQLKIGEQLTGYSPSSQRNGTPSGTPNGTPTSKLRRLPYSHSETMTSATSSRSSPTRPFSMKDQSNPERLSADSARQRLQEVETDQSNRSQRLTLQNEGEWTNSPSQQPPHNPGQRSPYYALEDAIGTLSLSQGRTQKRAPTTGWKEDNVKNRATQSRDALNELEGAVVHTMRAFADASVKSSSFSDGSTTVTASTSATEPTPTPTLDRSKGASEQQQFPGDTTALLQSVLGFLALHSEPRNAGQQGLDPVAAVAMANNEDATVLDGIDAESELWKFLEEQLAKEIDPSLAGVSGLNGGATGQAPTEPSTSSTNYQSSHEDLKALFSRWREESFSRTQGLPLASGGTRVDRAMPVEDSSVPAKAPLCFPHLHPQSPFPA